MFTADFIDSIMSNVFSYYDFMYRLFNLIYIFIGQISIHYSKNLFNICLQKPKLERLQLIKNIASKLEKSNIVYVKIFQSLSIDGNLLYDDESEFLMKYLDNVPYNSDVIEYDLLEKIKDEYNIILESNVPINAGIVSVVFNATYESKKVVIKMLKKDINEKLTNVFEEIEVLVNFLKYLPFIKEFNFDRIIDSNKDLLLNQTNFITEYNNIITFKNKLSNNPEYVIPHVYDITSKYPTLLIMENIKGLTYNDIIDYDLEIKDIFGKILYKLGIIGNVFHNAIHCDLHAGNVFFYINDDSNSDDKNSDEEIKKPKYQIGIIDFGIVMFPTNEKQDAYYKFFFEMQLKKDYTNIEYVINSIIEEKNIYMSMENPEKLLFTNDVVNVTKKHTSNKLDITFFYELSKTFNKYNFHFCNEFNNLCLSLQMVQKLGINLCKSCINTQNEILSELLELNNLIEIE